MELIQAAGAGWTEELIRLLEQGADVNATDQVSRICINCCSNMPEVLLQQIETMI